MDIQIRIKDKLLRAYLGAIFEQKNGRYITSGTSTTGRAINTLVKTSKLLPAIKEADDVVNFTLCRSEHTDKFRHKWLVISESDVNHINGVLKLEFECDFACFCAQSTRIGMKLNDAIEQFMIKTKMSDFFDGNIDTLKKRSYRSQMTFINNAKERLRKVANYKLERSIKSKNIYTVKLDKTV